MKTVLACLVVIGAVALAGIETNGQGRIELTALSTDAVASGASAESVVTWVDYDLGFTTPIVFDSGFSNVIPAEIGTFAVDRGDHLIEVMGETSGFFYVDADNGFMLFPENTTTIFDIK